MVGSSEEREAGIVAENEVDADHFFSQGLAPLLVVANFD